MQTNPSKAASAAWRLQDAKSQFSALVDNAMRGVPQHVTRRGKQAVVVVSEHDFEALQRSASSLASKPASFIEHLLAIPKDAAQDAAKDAAKRPSRQLPKMSGKARSRPLQGNVADSTGLDLQPREIDFS